MSGKICTLTAPWMRVPRLIREYEAEGYKLVNRERKRGGTEILTFKPPEECEAGESAEQ